MSTNIVRSEGASKSTREFIGRGWLNTVKAGTHAGVQFINVQLDKGKNGVQQVTITQTERLQLWPNNKRPDHPKDADYRVSVVSA